MAGCSGLRTIFCLEYNIREQGGMDKLLSDWTKAEMSLHKQQIFCTFFNSVWHGEHHESKL